MKSAAAGKFLAKSRIEAVPLWCPKERPVACKVFLCVVKNAAFSGPY